MAVSLARAKALCTENELSLIRASSRAEIGSLSPAQLKQKITRARTLRDKWTGQARTQRRAAQAARRSRQTDDNARSAEKGELFTEALTRFEKQLAKLEAKGAPAGQAKKKLAPRARSATHRAERADGRDSLKAQRLALAKNKKKKVTKAKAAQPALEPVEVFPDPGSDHAAEAPAKSHPMAPATSKKRKPRAAGLTAMEAARELQGLHVTKGQQLRATTAAKQTRLKASGILRIQKSTSAANKRRQAKRDSR